VFSVQNFSIGNGNGGSVDPIDPVEPIDPPSSDYPAYAENKRYNSGDIVEHNGSLYKCKPSVAAWCSGVAWAYAPKTGSAWGMVWDLYDPENLSIM
jgi:hypothetical protein